MNIRNLILKVCTNFMTLYSEIFVFFNNYLFKMLYIVCKYPTSLKNLMKSLL